MKVHVEEHHDDLFAWKKICTSYRDIYRTHTVHHQQRGRQFLFTPLGQNDTNNNLIQSPHSVCSSMSQFPPRLSRLLETSPGRIKEGPSLVWGIFPFPAHLRLHHNSTVGSRVQTTYHPFVRHTPLVRHTRIATSPPWFPFLVLQGQAS
jgi:hypothetical protein